MRCVLVIMAVAIAAAFVVGCDYRKEHGEIFAEVEPPGISGHNVTINYRLYGTELAGIIVKYSLDGLDWHNATQGWGGQGDYGLTTAPAGASHTWAWDSLADVGPVVSLNTMVKVMPWSRGKGYEATSPVFIVNNMGNTQPTAIILSEWEAASPQWGNIVVEYGVADSEADALTAALQFSVDGGVNFFDATIAQNAGGDLTSRLRSTFPTELNDLGGQLSNWSLYGLDLGVNTDEDGKLYVELSDLGGTREVLLYSDSAKSLLVAEGTRLGDGTVTLAEVASSGLSGSVRVDYTSDDDTVELACYTTHYLVWSSVNDLGKNDWTGQDVRLRIHVVDGEVVCTTPSCTEHVGPDQQIWVDNTKVAGLFRDATEQLAVFWSGSRDAVSADFDGDGDTDIFVCNKGENFYHRNDSGTFSKHGQILHDDSREVVSADFNSDGLPDVFCANKGWNMVSFSNGVQTLFTQWVFGICEETRGAACRDPAGDLADFDHDGNPDVFVCNLFMNTIYLNPGTQDFRILYAGVAKDDCRGAAIADFDGDGELDVYCCCRFQDRLLLGDGDGNFTVAAGALPCDWTTSWRAAAFDFEGDGDYDLFVGRLGQNIIAINQGGQQGGSEGAFRYAGVLPRHGNNTRSVAAFVRDGVTYLVEGNADGQSRLYKVYKGRVFDVTPVNFPVEPAFTYGVHVAHAPDDINGDGLTDIYLANWGQNVLLLGQ